MDLLLRCPLSAIFLRKTVHGRYQTYNLGKQCLRHYFWFISKHMEFKLLISGHERWWWLIRIQCGYKTQHTSDTALVSWPPYTLNTEAATYKSRSAVTDESKTNFFLYFINSYHPLPTLHLPQQAYHLQ